MAETSKPMPGFSAPAVSLAPLAGQLEQVKHKAEIEGLRLDPVAAKALSTELARLQEQVTVLVGECADLDQSLKFGANFVGKTVASRLQDTASGGDAAVTPVLTAFSKVLADLQATVQIAAGRYLVTDDETARKMRSSLAPFGLQSES